MSASWRSRSCGASTSRRCAGRRSCSIRRSRPSDGRGSRGRSRAIRRRSSRSEASGQGSRSGAGRTFTPNSHLALETAEYAQEAGHDGEALHRALFRAHFEEDDDLGDLETLLRIGGAAGLDGEELREALTTGRYRQQVDHAIAWAQGVGVTGVPKFIFD